jgi:hypothetical protein
MGNLTTTMVFGAITQATTFFYPSCTGLAASQGILGLAYAPLSIGTLFCASMRARCGRRAA